MTQTRIIVAYVAVCLFLCSCGFLTNEQQTTALAVIDQMAYQGTITAEQRSALVQAILTGSAQSWWVQLINVVGGAALAYAGVQWRRGPVATPAERAARIAPPAATTAAP
jgi:hypothetical protein